jgi:4-aminobutyrate aminotransferase-like enzyme/Ser/Thr protein kinase RdoA (MazF antagonist)
MVDTHAFDDVLHAQPPQFTEEEAARIAAEPFGVEGLARSLGSERDQTFLIDGGTFETSAVMKISNAAERADRIDMEALASLHACAGDPGLPIAIPRIVPGADPDVDGPAAYRATLSVDEGVHHVRMYDRLPGTASVEGWTLSDAAVRAWGETAARLDRAMRGFHHPAAERVMLWDVQHALQLRAFIPSIRDVRVRDAVAAVLDRYETVVTPVWRSLRSQAVHGDLCTDNALVDDDGFITGIIDFGDMSYSAAVIDAVAAAESAVNGRRGDDVFRTIRIALDGFQAVLPLEPIELGIFGELVAARACANVAITAWRAQRFPEIAEFTTRQTADAVGVIDAFLAVGFDEAARRIAGAAHEEDLLGRRRAVLGSALVPLDYDRPVHVVRGHGVWLFDDDGNRYLDAYNNVPVVGHAHPRVTEAIARQARRLNSNMRYVHPTVVELAERLVATTPDGLDTVMFVNTGSEANDLAWRLATVASGHRGGICTDHAYHGVTEEIAALSPENWPNGRKPDHIETFAPPDTYRRTHLGADGFAAATDRLRAGGHGLAAAYLDGVLTSDGVVDLDPAYAQELVRLTHDAGGFWVADEVQGGHGRTGDALWAFQRLGITPDIATLGKPMGNGHPVAAVITRSDIVDRFAEATDWFSTFAGNPVSAAAALAVLDVIEDEHIVERVHDLGEMVRVGLRDATAGHRSVGDVRGIGLINTVELVSDPDTKTPDATLTRRIVNAMRDRGVLIGTCGRGGNCLKIRPPLALTAAEVPVIMSALAGSLDAATG